MPEIELPPGKYRWRRPLSKPLAWTFVVLDLALLTALYWNRAALSGDNLFFGAVILAGSAGLILATLFKDID